MSDEQPNNEPSNEQPPPATNGGRGAKGYFAKGNKISPGRKPVVVERQYLQTLASEVSLADWAMISRRAIKDAKAGDAKAREWLSKYVLPPEGAGATLLDIAIAEHNGQSIDDFIRDQAVLSAFSIKSNPTLQRVFARWIAMEETRITRGLYGADVMEEKRMRLDVVRFIVGCRDSVVNDMRLDDDPVMKELVAEAQRELDAKRTVPARIE